MMFFAAVNDSEVVFGGKNDIIEIMVSLTQICNAISNSEKLTIGDRVVFRDFVRTELEKIAFCTDEEIKEKIKDLDEKIKKAKAEERKKSIDVIFDELIKDLNDFLEDSGDE